MSPPTKRRLCLSSSVIVAALAMVGCSTSNKQMTGTQPQWQDGHLKLVTYVTLEDYQRMSPAERDRLNATVGYMTIMPASKAQSAQPISGDELRAALAPPR